MRDRNLGTYWRTNNTGIKSSAWVYVDLGASNPSARSAGIWASRAWRNRSPCRFQPTPPPGPTSPARRTRRRGTWSTYTLGTSKTARYVRFLFSNPAPQTATLGGSPRFWFSQGTAGEPEPKQHPGSDPDSHRDAGDHRFQRHADDRGGRRRAAIVRAIPVCVTKTLAPTGAPTTPGSNRARGYTLISVHQKRSARCAGAWA